jgi:D-glycero-alpha-D-manno-heptose-7-phosphate kinase
MSRRVTGYRARAPLRLGLAGGGTDLSPFCDQFTGAVLNATIGRYAYAHLTERNDSCVHFIANDLGLEDVLEARNDLPTDNGLALHRAVYNRMVSSYLNGAVPAITISSTVDAPPGSGLGSSSALVVALVEVFATAFDLPLAPYEVARLAYEIERIDLGLAGGRQDQYAAAFGGINFIEFLAEERVIVNPLRVRDAHLNELEAAVVICFSGQSRRSEMIIKEQVSGINRNDRKTLDGLHQLKTDAIAMKQALLTGDIGSMAAILRDSWEAKRATAENISTEVIDNLFVAAYQNGALGGKVSGAGGGGFLMFIVDPETRGKVIAALNANGGNASPVHFTFKGVEAWPIEQCS